MKILVTGATGYVGGRLVRLLLEEGHDVRVLVRDPTRVLGRSWHPHVEVMTGDLVLVPSLTFIATANAVRHAGAEPLFVDADPATWQMDPALVAAFLADACDGNVERATGRRVGAVLPVDLLGHPADMDPIVAAARAAARAAGVPVVISMC